MRTVSELIDVLQQWSVRGHPDSEVVVQQDHGEVVTIEKRRWKPIDRTEQRDGKIVILTE